MKSLDRLHHLALVCLVFTANLFASNDGVRQDRLRTIRHSAFGMGERLNYDVVIGVINAGTATMSLPDTQSVCGRPCFRAVSTLSSNTLFDQIYSVRDSLTSVVDTKGLFAWQSRERIEEGKYNTDRFALFDPFNQWVIVDGDSVKAQKYTQDLLSVFYYIRTVPFRVGLSIPVTIYAGGELLSFQIQVLRIEQVSVPSGDFDCYVVEPGLRWRLPDGSEGKMIVWFSSDERRLPVLMKTNLLFGALEAQIRLTGF